jgi:hypothetical protein
VFVLSKSIVTLKAGLVLNPNFDMNYQKWSNYSRNEKLINIEMGKCGKLILLLVLLSAACDELTITQ